MESAIKIAIACPSEIALRRFLPALASSERLEFAGVGVCNSDEIHGSSGDNVAKCIMADQRVKAEEIIAEYGGRVYEGYGGAMMAEEADAVYIPLPPALHHKYAAMALEAGKHVLVEKPATCCLEETQRLVGLAKAKSLALHENYMFAFHDQIRAIDGILREGEIGDIRLARISFGFPRRATDDFRYNSELGGGALIDAGGYTLKYAAMLLGDATVVEAADLGYVEGVGVDMYGSGTLVNEKGDVVQVAFGMDNGYRCELEVWGSGGVLTSGRVLTAPVGFIPKAKIRKGDSERIVDLPADDSFGKSIEFFLSCLTDEAARSASYRSIEEQAKRVERFNEIAHRKAR